MRFVRAGLIAGTLVMSVCPLPSIAQVSAVDYARAARALPGAERGLVFFDQVTPRWIGGTDRFWYRRDTPTGVESVYVDPDRGVRQATATVSAAPVSSRRPGAAGEAPSPDGRWSAFVREHDLYVRETATNREIRLTTDGARRHDYASTPEASTSFITVTRAGARTAPQLLWSPDSRRLLTYQLDQRNRPELHLIESVPADGTYRPKLWSYVYPLPGDSLVATARWVFFDVPSGQRVDPDVPAFPVLFLSPFGFQDVRWSADGRTAYVTEYSRGMLHVQLRALDPRSGQSRILVEERGQTPVSTTLLLGDTPNVRVLRDGNSVIWFSERDGWGHLYLVDGTSGRTVRQITRGPWVVRKVLAIDEDAQRIVFTGAGREPGRNPYYRHLYSIRFDGTGLTLLSAEDADHEITLSPSGKWALDRYSRVDQAPVVVLRSIDGKTVLPLERADVLRLLATGWRYPRPFRVKAADDSTDIFGIIRLPSGFDSTRKYPVVEQIYPGPQGGQVPAGFTPFNDLQSITELGFVGVEIDGRGTPLRSRAFHDFSYGNLESAGALEDHIAGLRQLASRHAFLDLQRVGIFGHSAGGYASTRALLAYPDFYKVAVSSAGNHDQRTNIALWGERYQGMPRGDNYRRQSNASLAANLRGKLLLATGDLDDNVHPAATLQLIDALTRANKDYDLLVLPNGNHGISQSGYLRRRRWDYFVRHLLGVTPPTYELK